MKNAFKMHKRPHLLKAAHPQLRGICCFVESAKSNFKVILNKQKRNRPFGSLSVIHLRECISIQLLSLRTQKSVPER